jgi:hypothetical protein
VVKRERTGEYYNKQGTADKVYVENDGS